MAKRIPPGRRLLRQETQAHFVEQLDIAGRTCENRLDELALRRAQGREDAKTPGKDPGIDRDWHCALSRE